MRQTIQKIPRFDAGYVLLEVLVAAVIFAIAAYIAAPHISRRSGDRELQTASVLLVSEMRAAQAAAIKSSRGTSVSLDVVRHRLAWGQPVRVVALPASVSMSVQSRAWADAGAPAVHFHPDGSSNGARIVLRVSRRTSTVLVDWLTGETRMAARE